jgi:hypothetical protein
VCRRVLVCVKGVKGGKGSRVCVKGVKFVGVRQGVLVCVKGVKGVKGAGVR